MADKRLRTRGIRLTVEEELAAERLAKRKGTTVSQLFRFLLNKELRNERGQKPKRSKGSNTKS